MIPSEDASVLTRDTEQYGDYGRRSGRDYFVTKEGYIGLGPKGMRCGDEVCTLLGCDTPMVLRKDAFSEHFVVGESYVQGLMDAESILGPLPAEWHSALDINDAGEVFPVYWETRKDSITSQDPRMGQLPNGWNNHSERRYWNSLTGETSRSDPRLTSKALKDRGVDLKTFHLV